MHADSCTCVQSHDRELEAFSGFGKGSALYSFFLPLEASTEADPRLKIQDRTAPRQIRGDVGWKRGCCGGDVQGGAFLSGPEAGGGFSFLQEPFRA